MALVALTLLGIASLSLSACSTDDNEDGPSALAFDTSTTPAPDSVYAYTIDTAIPTLTLPPATGGTTPLTYTLTPAASIPAGLTFNPTARTLSGTPTAATAATTLTYTVTDSADPPITISLTFSVSINKREQANFSFATATITKLVDDAAFTPVPTGGSGDGAITYQSSNTAVATVDETTGDSNHRRRRRNHHHCHQSRQCHIQQRHRQLHYYRQ